MPTARSQTAAPFHGLTPLFGATALRDADADATRRFGIPGLLLMERAGLESAHIIRERFPDAHHAIVMVGTGNNAGDGMVVARHLAESGWRVQVLSPDGLAPTSTDAYAMSNIALSLGVSLAPFDAGALRPEGAVLVDALLGTGAHGEPRSPIDAMLAWADGWPGPVVALDVPTGVDADTGRVAGRVITADVTVTYHGDMPGLRIHPGRAHAGDIVVADIGIPSAVRSAPVAWCADLAVAAGIPTKSEGGEKYSAGAILVVAGAPGMTGAGIMSAQASLRAGAGLVVAAVPREVQPVMAALTREIMCAAVDDINGSFGPISTPGVLAQSARAGAVALGPGIGRAAHTGEFVRQLVADLALPVVCDADALWHLVGHTDLLQRRTQATVITPHSGEAARLLGCDRSEVDADRLAAAITLCHQTGAVVVLKGPGTIVCDPDGTVTIARDGGPELATAGSGDVLTGIIAALLAKGMDATFAATAAVVVHARAGERAGHGDGTLAGDLLEEIPGAIDNARMCVAGDAR